MQDRKALSLALLLLLAALAPASAETNTPPSTNKWQSSISLGLTITRGNSDTLLFSATGVSEKKWSNNDLAFGADALYGESKLAGSSSSTETADRDHAFVQYNRLFSERLYGFARADGLYDGIADIDYRATLAPGAGYYFIKNKTMDFNTEVGPGYIFQKLNDNNAQDFATLRLSEKFDYNIGPHSKAWETADILPQVDDFNNYIVNAEVGIEAGLNKKNNLALRAVLDDNYNNVPAAAHLKNDVKLITSIVYKF